MERPILYFCGGRLAGKTSDRNQAPAFPLLGAEEIIFMKTFQCPLCGHREILPSDGEHPLGAEITHWPMDRR